MNDVDDKEFQEFQEYVKDWAFKKMQKLEKKLQRYARMYFGDPVAILYARNGVKIVHGDGTESIVRVFNQEVWHEHEIGPISK